jgi:putative transposase
MSTIALHANGLRQHVSIPENWSNENGRDSGTIVQRRTPMRKSQFSEQKIVKILNEAELGATVEDVCRKHGISHSTYYRWKAKYGGMEVSDIQRLKELEEENRRLKKMYAELSLDHEVLKDLLDVK